MRVKLLTGILLVLAVSVVQINSRASSTDYLLHLINANIAHAEGSGDGGGTAGGGDAGGGSGCCGGESSSGGNAESGGGSDYTPSVTYSCTNGATNYPYCNNNRCTNGYSNYPTCGPTTCTNGATNFPYCNNNVCTNGATNYPSCNNNVCSNGATNYPYCNNNVCTNGATNYPACNNICTNGYLNYPTCGPTTCSNGATNFPYCNNNTCTNGATNYPFCNNNIQYCSNGYSNYPTCGPTTCTNGATNFPYCNNQYVPPTYVWCNGVQYPSWYVCPTPYIPPYVPPAPVVPRQICPSVSTTGATAGYTTATILGLVNPNGNGNTQISFDYGTNYNLIWHSTVQTTSYAGQFSAALSGLTCGTRYYYRASATSNSCHQNCNPNGAILSFTTAACQQIIYYTPKYTYKVQKKVVYIAPPKIKKLAAPKAATCLCDTQQYLALTLENIDGSAVPGKLANYKIDFKNASKETLHDVAIRVVLPEQMTVYSVDRGQFTKGSKTLTFAIGDLQPAEEGMFVLTTSVDSSVALGTQMTVNGYADYTVPTVVKAGVPLKGEVNAYVIAIANNANIADNNSNVTNSNLNTTTATNIWSWLPSNFFEWIIFIIVFIIFISALRYVFGAFRSSN